LTPEALRAAALAVLEMNDLGGWTKPAPRLYPHQWSWDSAFIAIGLASVNPDRALRELETLFEAQWTDGRVPHIVFNPSARDYFPGPEWWASAPTSVVAPRDVATSGLIQPPVHALALEHVFRAASAFPNMRERIALLYPKVLAWHRYLAMSRDPSGTGLLVIYHPWESGTDNSPRWDSALARLEVGDLPEYQRHDLKHVEDPAERPTHEEYDRYLWLVDLLKRAGYDDSTIQRDHPFQIRDVLMSAIFATSSAALASLASSLGRPSTEVEEARAWCTRSSAAVCSAWQPELNVALDFDVVAGESVRVQTCAGLSPLIVPELPADLLERVIARTFGDGFAGAAGLAEAVVPSTVPDSPGWHARSYWRGPSWPIMNWLLWWGLLEHGRPQLAERLRASNLGLLAREGARFAEYFEPFTAEPLGSLDQSWTAAVALDWLAFPRSSRVTVR
jgi:glucosylglycerate hydrolase